MKSTGAALHVTRVRVTNTNDRKHLSMLSSDTRDARYQKDREKKAATNNTNNRPTACAIADIRQVGCKVGHGRGQEYRKHHPRPRRHFHGAAHFYKHEASVALHVTRLRVTNTNDRQHLPMLTSDKRDAS